MQYMESVNKKIYLSGTYWYDFCPQGASNLVEMTEITNKENNTNKEIGICYKMLGYLTPENSIWTNEPMNE